MAADAESDRGKMIETDEAMEGEDGEEEDSKSVETDESEQGDENSADDEEDGMMPPPTTDVVRRGSSDRSGGEGQSTPDFVSNTEMEEEGDGNQFPTSTMGTTPAVQRARALRHEFHSPSDALMSPCTQKLFGHRVKKDMKVGGQLSHPASILREKQHNSIPPKLMLDDELALDADE